MLFSSRRDYIVNSYANSANLTTMIQYNNAEVKSFQTFEGPGLFKVWPDCHLCAHLHSILSSALQISWTLTPDANCIIDGYLFPNLPTSLIALADSANPSLAPWAAKYFGAGQPVANIVIVDHLETSAVVKVAATSSAQSFPPLAT